MISKIAVPGALAGASGESIETGRFSKEHYGGLAQTATHLDARDISSVFLYFRRGSSDDLTAPMAVFIHKGAADERA